MTEGTGPVADVPPPEKAPGWFLSERRVRRELAITAGLVALTIGGLIFTAVLVLVPARPSKQKRFTCSNNLSQLVGVYALRTEEDPAWRPRSGTALFLEWRKDGRQIRPGQETILICPGDEHALLPDTPEARARYDAVDLDHPPEDLCSYAVRDFERFPIDPDSDEPQVIAVCVGRDGTLRHKNGVTVAYDDGSARFVDIEELEDAGLPPGAAPVPGPDSPCSILRVVRFSDLPPPAPR